MKEMNERQKKFCYEYVKDFNGSRAAVQAGYSAKVARSRAYHLLEIPRIREFLETLKERDFEKSDSEVARIISELKIIAFGVIDGVNIKATDKLRALEMLGKYLGMFSEMNKEPIEYPKVRLFYEDIAGGKLFNKVIEVDSIDEIRSRLASG